MSRFKQFTRQALICASAAALCGCVEVLIVGHTDDWSDYVTGVGTFDPVTTRSTASIRFTKLGITCSGTSIDYAPARGRGDATCDDGRAIKTETIGLSMSRGKGTSIDQFGNRGSFEFFTDRSEYEAELARVRAEVERRNLSVAHLRVSGSTFAPAPVPLPPAAPTLSSAPSPTLSASLAASAPASPPLRVEAATAPAPASAAPASMQPVGTADSGRRLALVIGNSAYRDAPLKNPVNDARALAGRLRSLGFDVMTGENMAQRDMNRLITQFGERLAGHGVGLFFFAGHGIQVRGKNYLIPVDAQIVSENSVRSETVDVDAVLDQLSSSPMNVVILDACRNNPFERRFRSLSVGLAQMDAPKGTLIAYATAPGKVALDGDGSNSTYTTALLRTLGEPGLPVESLFKRVRMEVARATSDLQVPWESSSLTGDFYFGARDAAPKQQSANVDHEAELIYWQSVKDSPDVEDLKAYLRRYPTGRFADIAKNRLNRMGTAKTERTREPR